MCGVYSFLCIRLRLPFTGSAQAVQYLLGNDCEEGALSAGRLVEALFNSQRLVNVSFLGRGGWGESVKKENESPHRVFINLTHGLWAQIEAGNSGNSNHVTRTVYYHEITNLLGRQYNLHISSPISNCLTLICCWKEAHSRRGSERQASRSKAFRSHNGRPSGFQDFTREGFKGKKKPHGWWEKRFFWNRKQCLIEII